MILRARLALAASMSTVLALGTGIDMAPSVLDPAGAWRILLTSAGCPADRAHALAVRIVHHAQRPPDPRCGDRLVAEQVVHLVRTGHRLALRSEHLDAALAMLVAGSGPATARPGPRGATPPPSRAPPAPFTTTQARELLSEWLPTPGPR